MFVYIEFYGKLVTNQIGISKNQTQQSTTITKVNEIFLQIYKSLTLDSTLQA